MTEKEGERESERKKEREREKERKRERERECVCVCLFIEKSNDFHNLYLSMFSTSWHSSTTSTIIKHLSFFTSYGVMDEIKLGKVLLWLPERN